MKRIVRNSVKCLICMTEIESIHRHDFVSCPCGNVFVDGGHDYLRRGWKDATHTSGDQPKTWEDTSIQLPE